MQTSVILSAAKDLAERSDTGRVAGVRSFAQARRLLRATQDDRETFMFNRGKLTYLDAFQRRKWSWSTFSAGAYAATRFLDSFKLA